MALTTYTCPECAKRVRALANVEVSHPCPKKRGKGSRPTFVQLREAS